MAATSIEDAAEGRTRYEAREDQTVNDGVPLGAARELIRRQRRLMRFVLLIGVVLFAGGLTGFGIYGSRKEDLLKIGTHTTAIVVHVAPYGGGGPFGSNSLGRAHIDVRFPNKTGRLVIASLGIGDYTYYRLGQQLQIVYNPAKPTEAVFAHGYTDIGPMGFLFFAAIASGFALAVFGVRRLALWRRATHALREPPTRMTATSRFLSRSRFQTWAISLADDSGKAVRFWSATKQGCSLLEQPTPVVVFGAPEPRSVVIAVDAERLVAIGGRIPRRWREPRMKRQR